MADTNAEIDVEAEVGAWLDANWDPSMTVGEWWQRLADSGYSHPSLPEHAGGKGWSQSMEMTAMRTMAARDVVGPPPGLGYMLAAPTIADHGTPEQVERFLPSILNGREAWCQLFSEPGAGSDLAGLQTKAEKDGDEWGFTGQKVWTSQGHLADLGMLIARTDPDRSKHRGISYFALAMDQPGVEVRPLKEMTGRSFFSEVFMDDARASEAALIGTLGDGWRVANTTLAYERAHIGGGSAGLASLNPGSKANSFDRICGDVVTRSKERRAGAGAPGVGMRLYERYRLLATELGRTDDPIFRQELMKLYTILRVNRMNIQRSRNTAQRTGGEGNIAKLYDAEIHHAFREIGLAIAGADGMLMGASSSTDPAISELALFSLAPSIYGGTNQIQKNIIGERVLGLPKEPGPDKTTPFSELPKNQ